MKGEEEEEFYKANVNTFGRIEGQIIARPVEDMARRMSKCCD